MHFLVVDDNKMVREMVAAMIRSEGFQVRTAESGAEALAVCDREQVDVVLTDLEMPEMCGRQLARELVRLRSGCKIYLMTGTDISPEAAGPQFEGVLYKPFNANALSSLLWSVS